MSSGRHTFRTPDVFVAHVAINAVRIFPLRDLVDALAAVHGTHVLRVFPSEAHVCLNYVNQYAVDVGDGVANELFGH